MTAPILLMLAPASLAPGWRPIHDATPAPGSTEALALVVRELCPLDATGLITPEQRVNLTACLPPEGYRIDMLTTVVAGEPSRFPPGRTHLFGFWFSTPALEFVRRHHPGVRWSHGAAEGAGTVTEIDLLHGWNIRGRCVAVVCRMAPRMEAVTMPASRVPTDEDRAAWSAIGSFVKGGNK